MLKGRTVNHPGTYIKDALEELDISQSEFAYRSGLSIKNVSTLINGESPITFGVAIKLASFFGNSVEGWINLQTKYDLYLYEVYREEEYKSDWEVVKIIDKKFASSVLQINIDNKNKEDTIDRLRRSFNVVTLQNLKHTDMYAFYKTSVLKDIDDKTVVLRNAWISLAEKEARNISVSQFDKVKIINNQKYLRSLTLLSPEMANKKLKEFLEDAGIKLVVLPYLSGSNVSGVTKWISSENAVMVAINDCGKDASKIWFTMFHELGHAIKNHKRHMTISYEKDQLIDCEEEEANNFAKNLLIDQDKYDAFVKDNNFSEESIRRFASEQNVADFIVLGRLQKDGYLPWNIYPGIRTKYEFN